MSALDWSPEAERSWRLYIGLYGAYGDFARRREERRWHAEMLRGNPAALEALLVRDAGNRLQDTIASARRAEERAAENEERALVVRRLRARARTESPIWAPGSRNHLVWAMRQRGRTLQEVATAFGISRERVRGIVSAQAEIEEARSRLAGTRSRDWAARRWNLGRPLDIDAAHGGGPRDVWLTWLPSPDPRLDNMVPVPAGAGP